MHWECISNCKHAIHNCIATILLYVSICNAINFFSKDFKSGIDCRGGNFSLGAIPLFQVYETIIMLYS